MMAEVYDYTLDRGANFLGAMARRRREMQREIGEEERPTENEIARRKFGPGGVSESHTSLLRSDVQMKYCRS